jgi:uncharacterized SAM-binding protein YcdF (DUF218 family)
VEEDALMFFVLSKTVALLLLPSNLLIGIGLVGLALTFTRWRRAGQRIVAVSLVLLLSIGVLPIGRFLTNALENHFPRWDASRGAPIGIIVLGGAISPGLSHDRGEPAVMHAAGRITAISRLARQFPSARIVYSGGNGALAGGLAEADFVAPLLDDFGIPRQRVILEDRSRNTEENAVFTKALVQPKAGERWLLVTSAMHMPRAVGCFRRAGFAVEAYPVDWTTFTHPSLSPSGKLIENLNRADDAVHEWFGLLAYWLTGRTSAFLPAP